MKNKKVCWSAVLALLNFVAVLAVDLLTKHFLVKALPNVGDSKEVLPGFINFIFVKNTGAAWGVLSGRPIFLIVLTLVILGLYLTFFILNLKKNGRKSSKLFGICAGFIFGGCLGNLVDRLFLGYVRDFINFQFISFPVFNVADIALCVGVVLLAIYFIFIYPKECKRNEQSSDQQALSGKEGK